ncbi:hypothetical protein GCM10010345_18080 [Streptomyces canarius]|uniref:Uncharacterized protein n=1 Tax=Streptomyces canarius TaxID=285453 RepID=A0ABQ3CKP5_9ACTN|nr:hypothetical protein GCM10010345_18080 [Streptomyces canarius]
MWNGIEWNADEALDDVRRYVVDNLGDPDAVVVVDDRGLSRGPPETALATGDYGSFARDWSREIIQR